MLYLYRFSFYSKPRAGTLIEEWTHTNYEKPVTHPDYPGLTFTPQPGITHAAVTYDSEKSAGQMTVTVPRDYPVAAMFLGGYPYGSVYLRIIEVDSDATDATAQVIWMGRLRTCAFAELTAELTGTDGREMLSRLGLRLNGGKNCQWDHFGPECGLDEATYTHTGTVTAIATDGLTITTTLTGADGFYKAGKMKAGGQARMVTKNVGGVLTLMSSMPLTVGDTITATKGCDRTPSATTGCKAFSNYAKFSGFADFETPQNIFSKGVL